MALPVDHDAADQTAPTAPSEATTGALGADGAGLVVSQAGAISADIVGSLAIDGPKADLTVLDLEDLMNLRLDDDVAAERSAGPSAGLTKLLATADLPADLTDLDLEQVLGLDIAGDALPTVLEVARLPADLTALELAQVLGLTLEGATLPTIEEVVQLALQSFDSSNKPDSDNAEAASTEPAAADADIPLSNSSPITDADLSFLNVPSLTEQAQSNSAQAAATESQGQANGNAFGAGSALPGNNGGLKPGFDFAKFDQQNNGPAAPADEGGGGGGGGGNVINGTAGNDVLLGTTGIDIISGLGGDDILRGRASADTLDGGTGTDTATYQGSGAAVTVSLATGTGLGGDAQGDTLVSIENLIGSSHDDTLTGDGNANTLDGAAGNSDTADYSASGAGVTVDVGAGTGLGGDAQGDTLVNIEAVTGSAFNDTLTGDNGANVLDGGAGDDALTGNNGNDVIDGGAGIDSLFGDAGNDTLVWDFTDLVIDGGAGNGDTLRVDSGNANITTFGGTITGVENVDLLSDGGANALTLTAADVLAISDTNIMTIDGDALDSVDVGGGWAYVGPSGAYDVYTQGAATLNVDIDMTTLNWV
jgi:Ca2+-binding RTX toxin-like protein